MTTDRLRAAERIDDFGHVREDVGELTAALDRPAACVIDNIVGALPPQFGRGRSHFPNTPRRSEAQPR